LLLQCWPKVWNIFSNEFYGENIQTLGQPCIFPNRKNLFYPPGATPYCPGPGKNNITVSNGEIFFSFADGAITYQSPLTARPLTDIELFSFGDEVQWNLEIM
jgi:hypothetical protein